MYENSSRTTDSIDRWLNAGDAGQFFSQLVGLEPPFTCRQMWRYGRTKILPCKRIGRRMWFSENTLRAIADHGLDPRQMEADGR